MLIIININEYNLYNLKLLFYNILYFDKFIY